MILYAFNYVSLILELYMTIGGTLDTKPVAIWGHFVKDNHMITVWGRTTDLIMLFLFLFFYRHFLFKTGTGTTPFFGAAAPGYTMATGTVYSTPARPLPRNSLSRGAFKFKKSPKHCSWKCTALIAVGIAVVLSIILCYCIGKAKININCNVKSETVFHD